MAKAFSDSERETIRDRLCAAAEIFLGERGIRKTSVEELASAARISKGAFYLFYHTKEELFFDVIMRRHEEIEGALVEKFSKLTSPTGSDLADLIIEFFRSTSESFFPKFLASGELELLMRALASRTCREPFAERCRNDRTSAFTDAGRVNRVG